MRLFEGETIYGMWNMMDDKDELEVDLSNLTSLQPGTYNAFLSGACLKTLLCEKLLMDCTIFTKYEIVKSGCIGYYSNMGTHIELWTDAFGRPELHFLDKLVVYEWKFTTNNGNSESVSPPSELVS